MDTALLWLGGLIIIAAIVLLIKQYETRFVLIAAGLLMCTLKGQPFAAFNAFAANMILGTLVQTILSVMGFAYVMKITKCDAHLVNLMMKGLKGVRPILIPGSVMVMWFINISLPSAAGSSAAVGAILIPMLISFGVHPALAGTAVMAGTFGSMLSPGLSHNAMIAGELLKTSDIMGEVIAVHYKADIVTMLIGAASVTILARILKEDKGYVPDESRRTVAIEKVNLLYAAIPVIPVFLLVISGFLSSLAAPAWAKDVLAAAPWMHAKVMQVPTAMLIGVIFGLVVTRTDPSQGIKDMFTGMGTSYANVMGLIIAAGVFVAGMQTIGLQEAFLAFLRESTGMVKWATGLGPFLLAIISGSGDAATLAFNKAITPHAVDFGMTIANMGSIATLGGMLGRTMSPVTAACIICASFAHVSPIEIAKRNAPGMIIAVFVGILMLG
jgi:DcuC family C4-dicarboxylate transporter